MIQSKKFETNNDDGSHLEELCKWIEEQGGEAEHDGMRLVIQPKVGAAIIADCGCWVVTNGEDFDIVSDEIYKSIFPESENVQPEIPVIPPEAKNFAEAVAKLAEENGIREVEMEIKVDQGFGTRFWPPAAENIQRDMRIVYTGRDYRGRPCQNLSVSYDVKAIAVLKHTPASSD